MKIKIGIIQQLNVLIHSFANFNRRKCSIHAYFEAFHLKNVTFSQSPR